MTSLTGPDSPHDSAGAVEARSAWQRKMLQVLTVMRFTNGLRLCALASADHAITIRASRRGADLVSSCKSWGLRHSKPCLKRDQSEESNTIAGLHCMTCLCIRHAITSCLWGSSWRMADWGSALAPHPAELQLCLQFRWGIAFLELLAESLDR